MEQTVESQTMQESVVRTGLSESWSLREEQALRSPCGGLENRVLGVEVYFPPRSFVSFGQGNSGPT